MCIRDSSIGGLLLYIDHLCDRPPCGWNATMGPQDAGLGWDSVPWNWFHRISRSSWHIRFLLQKKCKPLSIVPRCGGINGIQVIRNFWKHCCPAAVFASSMQIPGQPTTFTPVLFFLFVHLYVHMWKIPVWFVNWISFVEVRMFHLKPVGLTWPVTIQSVHKPKVQRWLGTDYII